MSFAECGQWWTPVYFNPCLRCHKKGCDCCAGVGIHRTRAATQQAHPGRKRPTSGFNASNRRPFNDK